MLFKRLFAAIANLTASMELLALSVTEADRNFRQNLGLDYHEEPAQLEHQEPAGNGKSRRKAARPAAWPGPVPGDDDKVVAVLRAVDAGGILLAMGASGLWVLYLLARFFARLFSLFSP
jgi:hypothetical protein